MLSATTLKFNLNLYALFNTYLALLSKVNSQLSMVKNYCLRILAIVQS